GWFLGNWRLGGRLFPFAQAQDLDAARENLGRVALDAISVEPFAGLKGALHVDQRALGGPISEDLGQPAEDHDSVPLRPLAAFAGLAVLPAPRGCHPEACNGCSLGGSTDFG